MIPLYTMRQSVLAEREAFVRAVADPGPPSEITTLRSRAEDLIAQQAPVGHAFFSVEGRDLPRAVRLWVMEEYSVLNTLSRLLCHVAGTLDNVRLRSRFLQIVVGEGRTAEGSHAHQLAALISRLNIDRNYLQPLGPATRYMKRLRRIADSCPLAALGASGVGHEMRRASEHRAVLRMIRELPEEPDQALERYFVDNSAADALYAGTCLR